MQNTKKTKASNETNEYSPFCPNFLYFQKKELSYK